MPALRVTPDGQNMTQLLMVGEASVALVLRYSLRAGKTNY
jgi:hypothetical protein